MTSTSALWSAAPARSLASRAWNRPLPGVRALRSSAAARDQHAESSTSAAAAAARQETSVEEAASAPGPPALPAHVWRPSLDDVQRISMGDAARHRGTGSRAVPHRLNAKERKQYDLAKAKGVLTLAGSGYRRERKGSPAANIFRQWCDAKAQPCVLLAKGASAATGDTVLVDLSVLRLSDVRQYRERCRDIARQHGCSPQPDSAMQSPFTVILPAKLINAMLSSGGDGGGGISNLDGASDPFQASTSPASQSTSGGADGDEDDSVAAQLAELRASQPIWQQPPLLEGYTTDRGAAKALAKALAEQLPGVGPDA